LGCCACIDVSEVNNGKVYRGNAKKKKDEKNRAHYACLYDNRKKKENGGEEENKEAEKARTHTKEPARCALTPNGSFW
jgi:hypothetical protein